jgi:hypothetical protein
VFLPVKERAAHHAHPRHPFNLKNVFEIATRAGCHWERGHFVRETDAQNCSLGYSLAGCPPSDAAALFRANQTWLSSFKRFSSKKEIMPPDILDRLNMN